jgi:ribonuclease P protein component
VITSGAQLTDLDVVSVPDVMEPDREQAYFPAEQSPAGEDAWLSAAHAYPGRPRHHLRPAPQGAAGTVGLTGRSVSDPAGVPSMLPAANRMRRSADFAAVVRHGRRAGSPTVVVHHHFALRADGAALVGLVVGRNVGNSVVRHRVSRRLRAQLAGRVHRFPDGSGTVVRAMRPAAPATSAELGRDLDRVLHRVLADPDGVTQADSAPRRSQ